MKSLLYCLNCQISARGHRNNNNIYHEGSSESNERLLDQLGIHFSTNPFQAIATSITLALALIVHVHISCSLFNRVHSDYIINIIGLIMYHAYHALHGGGWKRRCLWSSFTGCTYNLYQCSCNAFLCLYIALVSYWPTEIMKQEFRSYCNYYKVKNELNPSTETECFYNIQYHYQE